MTSTSDDLDAFLASYAGIDGGNPRGRVWFCGIEHGGSVDSPDEPLTSQLRPDCWSAVLKRDGRHRTWPYHQKVAKVMVAVRSLEKAPSVEPSLAGWRDYLDHELYSEHGDTFKLNLFPLGARSVNDGEWESNYARRPGLESKQAYYERCRAIRFPFLAGVRRGQGAKVIVGTGITFRSNFAQAFGFDPGGLREFKIRDAKTERTCFRATDAEDTLIVSPFFGGRYGVNSDGLMIALAQHVAGALPPQIARENADALVAH